MPTPCIYVATCNINQKQYVGYTQRFRGRRKAHIKLSKVKKPKTCFHRALRKYGPANWTWEILEKHDDPQFALRILEPKWIKKLNTIVPNGYNMNEGGQGNYKLRTRKRRKPRYTSAAALHKSINRRSKRQRKRP